MLQILAIAGGGALGPSDVFGCQAVSTVCSAGMGLLFVLFICQYGAECVGLSGGLLGRPVTREVVVSRIPALTVRVYLSESGHEMRPLLKCLHDELQVCGVTVMRGIAGYGGSGVVRDASLVDLSLDLPLVLEFFDLPEKAERAIERIADFVGPGHVVSWPVTIEGGGKPC